MKRKKFPIVENPQLPYITLIVARRAGGIPKKEIPNVEQTYGKYEVYYQGSEKRSTKKKKACKEGECIPSVLLQSKD